MGMFKNNEAFHFLASYAHVCLDFKDQTQLKCVMVPVFIMQNFIKIEQVIQNLCQ